MYSVDDFMADTFCRACNSYLRRYDGRPPLNVLKLRSAKRVDGLPEKRVWVVDRVSHVTMGARSTRSNDGGGKWRLLDRGGRPLHPLLYSNGKTQEGVVNEILEALDDHDIVFLVGGVGTGKSAIALHIIDHYGKGIISTPTKILERQYTVDYCGNQSIVEKR